MVALASLLCVGCGDSDNNNGGGNPARFAGVYNGRFESTVGFGSGTVRFEVAADGEITNLVVAGNAVNPPSGSSLGRVTGAGQASINGTVSGQGITVNYTGNFTEADGGASASGTWTRSDNVASGTWTATRGDAV